MFDATLTDILQYHGKSVDTENISLEIKGKMYKLLINFHNILQIASGKNVSGIEKSINNCLFDGVNATFNNISVMSWRSVLLVEETGENHRPVASH